MPAPMREPMKKMPLVTLISLLVVGALATSAQAYPRPGRTIRVTPEADVNGNPVGGGAPVLSGDGRVVLLSTGAPLVATDTNAVADCYVRDLDTGAIDRASVTASDGDPNGTCVTGVLSDDGRQVAWVSTATNIVPGDTNGVADVFVRDLDEGTTVRANVSGQEAQANLASTGAAISDDGNVVAFLSNATNLVAGDTNGFNDIFVRDLAAGTTERASVSSEGLEGATALANWDLSGNGRFVVFVHRMPWDGDRSSYDDVFVHDRATKRTELVSVATDGSQPNGNSFYPSISDDGRHVAFGTFGTNLVSNDFNGAADAFVRDRETGITERVSVTSTGGEVNNVVGVPVISGDGRYVTGNHLPTNYGYQDSNANTDVYVYDRLTGAIELASGTPEGDSTGNGISYAPTISDDGRRVSFYSAATNLLEEPQAANRPYVRDMGPALGVGALEATVGGEAVSISGFARFAGGGVFSVGDSGTDGAAPLGGELTGASATYRPEEEDVRLRLDLAPRRHVAAPLAGTTARRPGLVTYGIELTLGGVRHEVRATQTAAPTGTTFGLFKCDPACAQIDALEGGDATVGDAIVVSVPVAKLGGPGATVAFKQAWVQAGEANTGGVRLLDQIGLSSATIPTATLELGTAPAGTSADDVAFGDAETLDRGRFAGSVAHGSGPREVWARACIGDDCRTAKLALSG